MLKTEEKMDLSGAFGILLMDLALWVYSQKVKGERSEHLVCEGDVCGALGWTKEADFILTDIWQREKLLKQLE